MADEKPTTSESGASGLAKSFEDRLTFPDDSKKPNGTNPQASTFTPSKFDWADEVTTPVQEKKEHTAAGDKTSLEQSQTDGATTWLNGSAGLDEPEFDVNVKLADLQDDPNNPLYSAKTFDELNLCVRSRSRAYSHVLTWVQAGRAPARSCHHGFQQAI
jgi:ATP-dependent RNA helicase DDX19/DBP5